MENGRGRLQQMQQEVEEVRGIMLDNLDKAEQRDCGLSELENRSAKLQEKSKAFAKTSGQVKQKAKRENMKWKVILAVSITIIIIVIVIIVSVILNSGSD